MSDISDTSDMSEPTAEPVHTDAPSEVPLTDFSADDAAAPQRNAGDLEQTPEDQWRRSTQDLEAVYEIPVKISAVLGRTTMDVSNLLGLEEGNVVELDRKVGEAIDICVNNRLVARGEVVLVEDRLGITMTEIIKSDSTP